MLQVRESKISLRNSFGGPEHLRPSEGTLLTIRCKWTFAKRVFLSKLQRKCPMSQSQKNASLAAIARCISITERQFTQ